jgi:hypothetical protein
MMKEDLFSTASPTAINLKQDSVPKSKRPYKKNRAKKRMVTQAESFQINKLLEANLTPKDENGIVSFLNDMDDDKIAKAIGPHVSFYIVRHLRQKVFGAIRKISPRKDDTDTNKLEARVAELEKNLMHISRHAVSRLTRVEEETRITIYGPFASGKEAKDWGLNWGAEYDDPRWQLIMLSKENVRRDRDGPFLMVPLLSTV